MTVSATSTSVTIAREKAVEDGKNPRSNFAQVVYICYPINFRKKFILALLDLGSKINAVYPIFTKKLGLSIRPIDVGAQKIDDSMLDTYGMVIAVFLMTDKANRVRFFKDTFLVANVGPEVVFWILFLILSSTNVDFLDRKL